MKKKYILFIYIFICILFLSSCSFHPSNHNDGIWYSHEFYYLDSGDSYYEIEKKEYTYDYSTFVFKNDNTTPKFCVLLDFFFDSSYTGMP